MNLISSKGLSDVTTGLSFQLACRIDLHPAFSCLLYAKIHIYVFSYVILN